MSKWWQGFWFGVLFVLAVIIWSINSQESLCFGIQCM